MRKSGIATTAASLLLVSCAEDAPPYVPPPPPLMETPRAALPTAVSGTSAAPPEAVSGSSAPPAAPGQVWSVHAFRCDQLLGLDDDDRAAAAMFYYGYLASEAGLTAIDAGKIEGNIRRVMNRCAVSRTITVVDAFEEELGPGHP